MKCRKIVILFFAIIYTSLLNGQAVNPDRSNYLKYQYYRYLFRKYFTVVGKASSICIESDKLNEMGYCYPVAHFIDEGTGHSGTTILRPNYGDTNQELGFYLGVLATEYKLLANAGKNTDEILYELDCAITALRVRDANAEKYMYPSTAANQNQCEENGFIMRGSPTNDFYDQKVSEQIEKKYNDFVVERKNQLGGFEENKFREKGSNRNNYKESKISNTFASVDHVSYLLMGLALVKKCTEGVNYNTQPNYFKNQASDITNRIINYAIATDWNYYIPNTDKELPNTDQHEGWGGDARAMTSYFLAKSAGWITDRNIDYNGQVVASVTADLLQEKSLSEVYKFISQFGCKSGKDCHEYNLAILQSNAAIGKAFITGFENEKIFQKSITIAYPCWKLPPICSFTIEIKLYCYRINGGTIAINDAVHDFINNEVDNNLAKQVAKTLYDVGSGVAGILSRGICIPNDNRQFLNWLLGSANINTTDYVLHQYYWEARQPIFPLLYRYLHHDENFKSLPIKFTNEELKSYYLNVLNSSAPQGNSINGPEGWRASNRFITPTQAHSDKTGKPLAYFNNLDYMLLYNLYKLFYDGGKYPEIDDVGYLLKINSPVMASNSAATGFESIVVAGGKINKNITLYASKSIDILEGFDSEASSNFDSQIVNKFKFENNDYSPSSRKEIYNDTKIDTSNILKFKPSENLKNLFKSDSNPTYTPINKYILERNANYNSQKYNFISYPNPFNSTFKLKFYISNKVEATMNVYDVNGKALNSAINLEKRYYFDKGNVEIEIDCKNLIGGIYNLVISFSDGNSHSVRVVKSL